MTVFEDMQRVKALADEIDPRRPYIAPAEIEAALRYALDHHDYRLPLLAGCYVDRDDAEAGRLLAEIVSDHLEAY